jgi:hypothetical protein
MSTTPARVVDHDGHAATYVDWLTAVDSIAVARLGGRLRAPDSGALSVAAWSEGATPLEGFRRIRAALPVGQPLLANPLLGNPAAPIAANAIALLGAVAPLLGGSLPPTEPIEAIEIEATPGPKSYKRPLAMSFVVVGVLASIAVTGRGDTSAARSNPTVTELPTPSQAPARCEQLGPDNLHSVIDITSGFRR